MTAASAFTEHFAPVPHIAARVGDITFTPEGCWEWPSTSYGRVWIDGRSVGVHRLSLSLHASRPLAPSEDACHICDNPPCCNPAHLFVGSRRDNVHDCASKGRMIAPPRMVGLANCNARLTDDEIVGALQALDAGESAVALAGRLGVTRRSVAQWRSGVVRKAAHQKYLEQISDDTEGRNGGKPARVMRWIGGAL